MGDAVQTGAQKADKGLDQVEKSAKSAGDSAEKLESRLTKVGAGLGTLAGAFAAIGGAAREQDRLMDSVRRAYGEAGDEMIEFSNHLQDTTRFSNDAVQEALLFGTSLANNYGLATDQIQQLTTVAADMAQMFGISLPDAMSRLSGAIRGEGEAAELLGLNMSDAAVAAAALEAGITNWGVPGALSEAEKGAFRFQLLMEQTAFSTGAAAEAAEGAGGSFRQFINTMNDGVQGLGQFLGPLGEIGAEMAPLALLFPVAGGAAGKFAASLKAGGAAASLMSVAMNPLVLGVVGLGAAIGAGYLIYQRATEGQRELAESFDNTRDAIQRLKDEGFNALAVEIENLTRQFPNIAEAGNMAADELAKSFGEEWEPGSRWSDEFGIWVTEADAAMLAIVEGMNSTSEDVEAANNKMTDAMTSSTVDLEKFLAEVNRLFREMMQDPLDEKGEGWFLDQIARIDLSQYQKEADTVVSANQIMIASFEDIEAATEGIGDTFQELRFEGLDEAAAAVRQLDDVFQVATKGQAAWIDESGNVHEATQLSVSGLADMTFAFGKLEEQMASGNYDTDAIMADMLAIATNPELSPDQRAIEYIRLAQEVENTDTYLKELTTTMGLGAGAMAVMGAASAAMTDEMVRQQEAQQNLNDAMLEYVGNADNLFDVMRFTTDQSLLFSESVKYAGVNIDTTAGMILKLVSNLDAAADSLDAVLGYFNTIDELGSRSSESGAIADYLFGDGGDPSDGLGPLRELLDAERISLEQFNQTIADGIAIQESNLKVQEDLNKIRVDQIPLLKDQQIAYEQQIDALANMSAAEQQHALYMMDSANQAQIASLYATAYAVSLGEIPPEVGTNIIASAAQADPVLYDILETYGLIEEGAEGEILVNFPDAQSLPAAIQDLTSSINGLIVALGGIPPEVNTKVNLDDTEAKGKVSEWEGKRTLPDVEVPLVPRDDDLVSELSYYEAYELNIPVKFNVVTEGQELGSGLAADAANAQGSTVTITTELNDNASDGLLEVAALAADIDGTVSTFITELRDDASRPITEVARLHQDQDGELSTYVVALRDNASDRIRDVSRLHANLDGDTSTLRVNANTSDAEGGVQWARNLNGDVLATSYINIVTRYFNNGGGGPGQAQHGMVAGYANGGVIAELAEVGPEIVHFANGGTGIAAQRGLYNLTPGDRVLPANASRGQIGGGFSFTFNNYGTVLGVDDFIEQAAAQLGPAMMEAFDDFAYATSTGGV